MIIHLIGLTFTNCPSNCRTNQLLFSGGRWWWSRWMTRPAHHLSWWPGARWDITGQNGVHLVREISPWSSQVLCIGLAQNLKPILSDDKYWNINPNISAFGMWLICDNTWMYNIQAYAWMYHIQAFAWPQIWPNPIPNPIHGCNTFKIFEHMYALKYQQIWPNPISNPIHGGGIIKF